MQRNRGAWNRKVKSHAYETFSREKDQGTYTPKSVVTISVDGSLVRKRMFSGLFTSHALDLSEDLEADDKGEGQHT